ncbi:carbohydrate-binding protein [Catellatospora sp. NPDC049609]|uniref:carbohydrate-binding protein n=1 Tax=Catellatospora sp. NPDC049609 TaxID=3155505 RepID=UPI00342FB9AA
MEDDFGYEGRRRRRFTVLERLRLLPLVATTVFTGALVLLIVTTLHQPAAWNDALPWNPGPSQAPAAGAPIDPDVPLPHTPAPQRTGVRASGGPGAAASTTPTASPAASPGTLASPSAPPSPAPPPPAAPRTVRYEAEAASGSRARFANDHRNYSGNGFMDYENTAGSYVQWTVQGAPGQATLRLRFANASGRNRPMDISVNGAVVAQGVRFDGTRDWDDWSTATVTVTLTSGANTIRATATGGDGGPNMDCLDVTQ